MSRTYIIAEIGINHNGDVDIARKLIDVAADAGCDAVKFQKRDIELVYTPEDLDRPRESPWGTTNREQKLGLEFGLEEYGQIDAHCRRRGIEWFVSCWDVNSVDFIDKFDDVKYHKVASALLTHDDLLERIAGSGRKTILSTGMSSTREIEHAITKLGGTLDTVMHCTSTYPTDPSEMNLNVLSSMRQVRQIVDETSYKCRIPFGARIGFSNHYSGLVWVPTAIALGATVLEFHITLDRTMYGSDQAASIEPDGTKKLVDYVRLTEKMLGDGIKKVYDSEVPIREKLRGV